MLDAFTARTMNALLTDLYELNMVASYLRRDMNGLAIWMAYSNFFSRMGGNAIADYYAKLFRRGDV